MGFMCTLLSLKICLLIVTLFLAYVISWFCPLYMLIFTTLAFCPVVGGVQGTKLLSFNI